MMTEQMKREWKAYRKECKATNVEPVAADFLGIELTDAEIDMNKQSNWRYLLAKQPKVMSASAGR
jgi:hypothetical protein